MSKVIVALDFAQAKEALQFVDKIDASLCRLKVGKELFTAAGPALVETLIQRQFEVFLDLKFHDIPNTVAKACEAATRLGVWMLNVHASGGSAMMEAAREGVTKANHQQPPLLIGVTVLTSMNEATLTQVGVQRPLTEQVLALATLANNCGLDGVVCSAQEAPILRAHFKAPFFLVTPGIRPASVSQDDQTRIVTPSDAVQMGVDYLVIGRPITKSVDPLATLIEITKQLS